MPRQELGRSEKEWLVQGWKTLGLWFEERGIARRFTLERAADSVSVSRRQWIRYEQASKAPYERLDCIVGALTIERRRTSLRRVHNTILT